MIQKAGQGDQAAQQWIEHFKSLAQYIGVTVQ